MNLSVLNVVPRRQGQSFKEAMDAMVRLAQQVEKMGYVRYWVAEHHNTQSFASSATALLIQHILANTTTIRSGAGGVMLPNHSPYIVAEYYGTLETLYPGRVDLGLGRAPGTDMATAKAIRRGGDLYAADFPQEVQELIGYFENSNPVKAYPAAGLNVPVYILGSSTDSAHLAARLGLPYAFASHFAPRMLEEALEIYRDEFKPSRFLAKPYVIVGCNVAAADTNEEAEMLSTTMLQGYIDIITGQNGGLKPPVANEEAVWNQLLTDITGIPHFGPIAFDKQMLIQDHKSIVKSMSVMSFVGSKDTVKAQYQRAKELLGFDELMINSFIYDEKAQIHSFEVFKQAVDEAEAETK